MLLVGFFMLVECDKEGKCKPKFKPTKEKKRVGKWLARKVIVKVNMFGKEVPQNLWLSKGSSLLLRAEKINEKNILKAVGNDPQYTAYIKQVLKVLRGIRNKYGAVVMSEVPGKSVEVVKSVRSLDLPESFFKVPKGYKEFKNL